MAHIRATATIRNTIRITRRGTIRAISRVTTLQAIVTTGATHTTISSASTTTVSRSTVISHRNTVISRTNTTPRRTTTVVDSPARNIRSNTGIATGRITT